MSSHGMSTDGTGIDGTSTDRMSPGPVERAATPATTDPATTDPALTDPASADAAPADPASTDASSAIRDERLELEVRARSTKLHGWVWNVASETFAYGDDEITREYVDHTGAVAILALDEDDRVLLIQQYRHPVRTRDWELPAGLLDQDGEDPLTAAKRELAEEADLEAGTWHLLLDFWTSPGGSDESIRIYLARDLRPTASPFARTHEEADIRTAWIGLDEAIEAILHGDLHNPAALQGIFAAAESRRRGWATLRDPHADWPTRPPHPTPTPRALEGDRAE